MKDSSTSVIVSAPSELVQTRDFSEQLKTTKDNLDKDLAHLSNVLDRLDELGEILDEMLQTQDDVGVIHLLRTPSSINSSFADPSRGTT